MLIPEMRPPYERIIHCPPDVVLERIKAYIDDNPKQAVGSVSGRVIKLSVALDDAHYWSPSLGVTAQEIEDGVRLFGRFGPRDEVWTLFVAMYAATIFSGISGLMLMLSQMAAHESAWAGWVVAACTLGVCLIYLAALFGQRLALDQMAHLEVVVETAVNPCLMQYGGHRGDCALEPATSASAQTA